MEGNTGEISYTYSANSWFIEVVERWALTKDLKEFLFMMDLMLTGNEFQSKVP
jgi:hypothetical protein